MSIWKKPADVQSMNEFCRNTMVDHLDINITDIGADYIKGTMPVDQRTHQPMGLLHGGASVALAESLGSIAANIAVAPPAYCVGLEIKANHIHSVTSGLVTGLARPVHIGRTTHVWDITIVDENEKTVCVARLTTAVINR